MSGKHDDRAESRVVDRIRFVGEQDGIPERELKDRLISLLRINVAIKRAYLARVEYDRSSSPVVALCVRSAQSAESLVSEVGMIFSSMFDREQHLDVIFVDEEQEGELARVCYPFYVLES